MEFNTFATLAIAAFAAYQYYRRTVAEKQLEVAEKQIEQLNSQMQDLQPVAVQQEAELKRYGSQKFDIVISQETPSDRTAYKRATYAKAMLQKAGNNSIEVVVLLFGEEANETWEEYRARVKKEQQNRKKMRLDMLKATSPAEWCAALNQEVFLTA